MVLVFHWFLIHARAQRSSACHRTRFQYDRLHSIQQIQRILLPFEIKVPERGKGPWLMAQTIASGVGMTNAWLAEQWLFRILPEQGTHRVCQFFSSKVTKPDNTTLVQYKSCRPSANIPLS